MLELLKKIYAMIAEFLKLHEVPKPKAESTPWMDWMHSHLGEHEVSGKADNPFIMSLYKYGNYPTEHDEVPWCAVCVCAALELSGYKDTNRADAKSYDNYGTACELKRGAVVTLKHPGGGRHVGFCEDPGDAKTFKMLGGNQSNALNVKAWNKSEIVAVRWPVKL